MSGTVLENIIVGEFLFEFTSEQHWISKAADWFHNAHATALTTVCVDDDGYLCSRGSHFKSARYPVRVYWMRDER